MRQLALVLDALRMAAEVQHSREAIVTAREEERRRLRRELHDGLGSALAGIALTLQAAQQRRRPARRRARGRARASRPRPRSPTSGGSCAALRPPMLEDLGLAAALRAHADRLAPLEVELVLPGRSRRCPPRSSSRSTASPPRRSPTPSATRTRAAAGSSCARRRRGPARDRRRRRRASAPDADRGRRPALDARARRRARRPRRARLARRRRARRARPPPAGAAR